MSTEDAVTTAQPAAVATPDVGATIDDLSAIHGRVDELAATIGAIQAAFRQKSDEIANAQRLSNELQTQLSALTSANCDLQDSLEEKAKALADREIDLAALRNAFGTRNQEFDALNAQRSSVESKADSVAAAKAALDARIQALTADVDAILAQDADAQPVDALSTAETAEGEPPVEAMEAVPAKALVQDAPAVQGAPDDPMDALAGRVAALAALLSRKVDALAAANTDIDGVRAQLAAAQAERDRLSGGLADMDSQLAGYIGEYGNSQTIAVASAALPVAGTVDTSPEKPATATDPIAGSADRVAALAAVLHRRRQEVDDAQNQIALLEEQLGAVTTEKTNLEITLNEKEQALSDFAAQVTSCQRELQVKNAELEQLIQQTADTQAQLAAAQEANRALESQIATLNAVVEANRQRLNELDGSMEELAAALEAADDGAEEQAATRPATVGVAAGGTTALAAAARKQKDALHAAQAEADDLRRQLAEVTAAKETSEANLSGASADELNAQLESLTADKTVLAQQLADSQAQLEQVRSEFVQATAWQQRAPAIVNLGQSLSRMSDTKLAAANSSAAAGSMPNMVSAPQGLAEVKGIGRTYEQRLYKAGVGSFWELALCSDDDLKRILKLNELQLLHIDLDAIRADARRLAEETGTVGMLWNGEVPDDFEPIDGIGKTFEQRLYDAGIRTYKALAATTPEQLADIVKAKKPLLPDYQGWIDQARALMQSAGTE